VTAGQDDPDPTRSPLHAKGQHDTHNTGGDQRDPEQKGQQCRGEERILEGEKAGDDVERTEQQPEQKPAPCLDLKGVKHLGGAGDQHHDPDHEHTYDGRHDDATERDQPGDQIDNPKRDDPAPLGA